MRAACRDFRAGIAFDPKRLQQIAGRSWRGGVGWQHGSERGNSASSMEVTRTDEAEAGEAGGAHGKRSWAAIIGALGVVYGDIGTSPLYTLRQAFGENGPLAVTPDNVLGILSLVFWSLVLVVTVKYVTFILR